MGFLLESVVSNDDIADFVTLYTHHLTLLAIGAKCILLANEHTFYTIHNGVPILTAGFPDLQENILTRKAFGLMENTIFYLGLNVEKSISYALCYQCVLE